MGKDSTFGKLSGFYIVKGVRYRKLQNFIQLHVWRGSLRGTIATPTS